MDQCIICGTPLKRSGILVEKSDGAWAIFCPTCSQYVNLCPTCKNYNQCAFEQDPSPIPKVIKAKSQQGNTIIVSQIANPERINITCKQGCKCFNETVNCIKQYSSEGCDNYSPIWE